MWQDILIKTRNQNKLSLEAVLEHTLSRSIKWRFSETWKQDVGASFLCKEPALYYEDLCLIPRTHVRKVGCRDCLQSNPRETETGRSLGSLVSSYNLLKALQTSERPCLKTKKVDDNSGIVPEVAPWPLYTYVHTCMYIHTYVLWYTHAYTQYITRKCITAFSNTLLILFWILIIYGQKNKCVSLNIIYWLSSLYISSGI